MKLLVAALVLTTGSAAASTKDPFEQYMLSVKNYQPELRLAAFARACDVSIEKEPVYGVGLGDDWIKTDDLARDVGDNGSTYLNTAAVWPEAGNARLVEMWSLDPTAGTEVDTTFCMDESKAVRSVQVTQWSLPAGGMDRGRWIYQQQKVFDQSGVAIEKTGSFIDGAGKRVKRPALNEEEAKSFDWVPDVSVVKEIEASLLSTKLAMKLSTKKDSK